MANPLNVNLLNRVVVLEYVEPPVATSGVLAGLATVTGGFGADPDAHGQTLQIVPFGRTGPELRVGSVQIDVDRTIGLWALYGPQAEALQPLVSVIAAEC